MPQRILTEVTPIRILQTVSSEIFQETGKTIISKTMTTLSIIQPNKQSLVTRLKIYVIGYQKSKMKEVLKMHDNFLRHFELNIAERCNGLPPFFDLIVTAVKFQNGARSHQLRRPLPAQPSDFLAPPSTATTTSGHSRTLTHINQNGDVRHERRGAGIPDAS